MKRFYLVDVSSLFFRAFYAIRPLTSPSGLPTNAIYGFLSMIAKLMKEENPDYIVFCYDRKEPSFRKDIYPEYKANRSETPEDLVPQIPYIKKLADLLGIPSFEIPKYEADDIIGTLTKFAQKKGFEVYIVSGDKDFGQLIDQGVYLYDTMKEVKIDSAGVKEKWGIHPHQVIDYLSLVGDTSDNIPGVTGIGPKGAQKLLEEFESLDGIYKNIDQIKGASKEKLIQGKESAYLSKKLVEIVTNVPVSQEIEDYHHRPIQKEALHELLTELNFKNLDKMLMGIPQYSGLQPKVVQEVVKEKQPIKNLPSKIGSWVIEPNQIKDIFKKKQTVWGFQSAQGVFLGDEDSHQVYILSGESQDFAKLLVEMDFQWKGFDLKSFWKNLNLQTQEIGHPIRVVWDSMLAAYVIKAGESMEFDRVFARFTGQVPSDLPTAEEVFSQHLQLEKVLNERINQIHGSQVLATLDFPLVGILSKMENRGICLEVTSLQKLSQVLAHDIQANEKEIFKLAEETFNVGSPKQLSQILFTKLGLPPGKKTKTGFSTDSDVLEGLMNSHPIIKHILSYRELSKLKSTYVDALPLLVKEDGRIHTTFNQALTTTGRLSSVEPNLQNIPIRTERGGLVRQAFVAEKGKYLLSVDYSQIELRILAHYSSDKNLCQAFQNDLDIHQATAAEVFGVDLKQVTSDQRRTAKAINFGIAYGQGAFGLAENLGIARGEAQEIIKRYFEKFPGVQDYIQSTIQIAQRDGYVETLYGRRRYIDELKASNPAIKKFGERAAINAPIQGTASDIVKMAMIQLEEKIKSPMILQVHDELIFEASCEQLQSEQKEIAQIMEGVAQLKVPLKVNSSIGLNWGQAH